MRYRLKYKARDCIWTMLIHQVLQIQIEVTLDYMYEQKRLRALKRWIYNALSCITCSRLTDTCSIKWMSKSNSIEVPRHSLS